MHHLRRKVHHRSRGGERDSNQFHREHPRSEAGSGVIFRECVETSRRRTSDGILLVGGIPSTAAGAIAGMVLRRRKNRLKAQEGLTLLRRGLHFYSSQIREGKKRS